jgi:xanthine dehydrogenase accessory factor
MAAGEHRMVRSGDSSALRAALAPGTALCTLVSIDGGFSRRVGAQLAIGPDGAITGSLADGCLEAELARQAEAARTEGTVRRLRYGAGSPFIDFRLPCGAAVEVVVDPRPDQAELGQVIARLDARLQASLTIPGGREAPAETGAELVVEYLPRLRIAALGSGPEVTALESLAAAVGAAFIAHVPEGGLSSAASSPQIGIDPWTAIVFLFHDHEWERLLMPWALSTPAFLVGAIGGAKTREQRTVMLAEQGVTAQAIARIRAPLGLIPQTRDPQTLALAVLAEIVRDYEGMIDRQSK